VCSSDLADNMLGFKTWHKASEILNMADLLIVGRGPYPLTSDSLRAAGLLEEQVTFVPDFSVAVSATSVRQAIAEQEVSVDLLVASGLPHTVAEYVITHGLYRADDRQKDNSK